jgi:hypothetical protein
MAALVQQHSILIFIKGNIRGMRACKLITRRVSTFVRKAFLIKLYIHLYNIK